jgi:hypothetical protein
MRLVTFQRAGSGPEAGLLEGNQVRGLGTDMLSVIAAGGTPKPTGASYDLGP